MRAMSALRRKSGHKSYSPTPFMEVIKMLKLPEDMLTCGNKAAEALLSHRSEIEEALRECERCAPVVEELLFRFGIEAKVYLYGSPEVKPYYKRSIFAEYAHLPLLTLRLDDCSFAVAAVSELSYDIRRCHWELIFAEFFTKVFTDVFQYVHGLSASPTVRQLFSITTQYYWDEDACALPIFLGQMQPELIISAIFPVTAVVVAAARKRGARFVAESLFSEEPKEPEEPMKIFDVVVDKTGKVTLSYGISGGERYNCRRYIQTLLVATRKGIVISPKELTDFFETVEAKAAVQLLSWSDDDDA